MDIPCSGRPGWLAQKKHSDFPSLPSFGNALPQCCGDVVELFLWPVLGSCDPVLNVAHSRGLQVFPKHKICCLPWAQKPPNYETLVKRSLSKSGISKNKSSTALLHFSKCNNALFPVQLIMRNKGIKRDRNVLSLPTPEEPVFHVLQGSQQPALGAAVMCKLAASLEKESEEARELSPQAPRALIPADPWAWLLCQS